jgi:hypothetical protein
MNVRSVILELDAAVAETLEARAADRGISVSEVVAELVADDQYDPEIERMRHEGDRAVFSGSAGGG